MKYARSIAGMAMLFMASINCQDVTMRGSSAAEDLINSMVEAHKSHHSDADFDYEGDGSGAGQDFVSSGEGVLGFGDVPFPDKPADVVEMPFAVGAIAVYANLGGALLPEGITGQQICDIFSGSVAMWSDIEPSLPAIPPVPVGRGDRSGSTQVFNDYLTQACGASWTLGSGKEIEWGGGVTSVEGTSAIIDEISNTEGAIGYASCGRDSDAAAEVAVVNAAGAPVTCADGSYDKLDLASGQIDLANLGDDSVFPMPFLLYAYMPTDVIESGDSGDEAKRFMTHVLSDGQSMLEDYSFFRPDSSVIYTSTETLAGVASA